MRSRDLSEDRDATAAALAGVAREAGLLLAAVRNRSAGHVVKPDGSPTTAADLEAERLIISRLASLFPGVPVVAEETARQACPRDGTFFLVDPLDGTRDYLSGAGEYSVNVAMIRAGRPVASAWAVPPLGRVWAAGADAREAPLDQAASTDAWRPIAVRAPPSRGLVALVSRRHGDEETERCLGSVPVERRLEMSSAAKFGLIASGEADLYVRCGPTMEWDTAAGDHLVTCAGGAVVGPRGRPLVYGRPADGHRNGPFAAAGDRTVADRISLPT